MNPKSKIIQYCIFLWLTNWSLFNGAEEVETTLDLRALAIIASFIAVVCLGGKIWKILRTLLDRSSHIPLGVRLCGRWSYLLLLAPLALTMGRDFRGVAEDGSATYTSFLYGGGLSHVTIILSAIVIMLYQLLIILESYCYKLKPTRLSEKTFRA